MAWREFGVGARSVLRCTPTGQLLHFLAGNRAVDRRRPSGTAGKRAAGTRSRAVARSAADRLDIRVSGTSPVPQCSRVGEVAAPMGLEKIILDTEKGIHVPALVFVPSSGRERYPATLYLNSDGKSADASDRRRNGSGSPGQHSRRAGSPRMGESGHQIGPGPHRRHLSDCHARATVGKTMLGMQVTDLLATYEYTASRSDVDPAGIRIRKGHWRCSRSLCGGTGTEDKQDGLRGMSTVVPGHGADKVSPQPGRVGVARRAAGLRLARCAASIAPRTLWIVDPRKPSDAPSPRKQPEASTLDPLPAMTGPVPPKHSGYLSVRRAGVSRRSIATGWQLEHRSKYVRSCPCARLSEEHKPLAPWQEKTHTSAFI